MFHFLKKRFQGPPVTGANIRIRNGTFSNPNPIADFVTVDPKSRASIYAYVPGDIFTPGAESFVFEPNFELPMQTIWGFAFLRKPNTFSPLQPNPVVAQPHLAYNGIGGLQAGTIELNPLVENEQ